MSDQFSVSHSWDEPHYLWCIIQILIKFGFLTFVKDFHMFMGDIGLLLNDLLIWGGTVLPDFGIRVKQMS